MDIKKGDWVTKEGWDDIWYEVDEVTKNFVYLISNEKPSKIEQYSRNIPKGEPQWIVRKDKEVYGICTHEGKYEAIGKEIGALVDEKNKSYGDSFGQAHKFLELLWPDGIPVDGYKTLLTITRIFDKLKRIATNNDSFGENPFRDLAGYAILEVGREGKQESDNSNPNDIFEASMQQSKAAYQMLLNNGWSKDDARKVLPKYLQDYADEP